MEFRCKYCNSVKIKKCDSYYECEYCGARFTKDKTHEELATVDNNTKIEVKEVRRISKILPFVLIPVFVAIIVLGIIAFVNMGANAEQRLNGGRVFDTALFDSSMPERSGDEYKYTITGNLTNKTDRTLQDVTLVVKYQIGSNSVVTTTKEGIEISPKGVYTYSETVTSSNWALLNVISVVAVLDDKEYVIWG